MDQIFDRLGNLLKSLFQNDDEDPSKNWEWRGKSADPDYDNAWTELNDFLDADKHRESGGTRAGTTGGTGGGASHGSRTSSRGGAGDLPEEIKRDYANLEVKPGAGMDDVRKSYHKLMREYHPDRFANNPAQLKRATEISQRINQSYQRIKRYRETGRL